MSRSVTPGSRSLPWRARLGRAVLLVPLVLLLMTSLFASDPPPAFAYSATSKDYVEIVIANGQYYAYDQGNPNGIIPPGWSGSLNDVTKAPRYNLNGGPCTYAPQGQACTFENYSIYQYHGHRWEAIEAYGRYWNFDLDNNYAPIGGNGGYLSSLDFYNAYYTNQPIRDGTATFTGPGPCYGITGPNCKLDSRGFYWRNNRLYDAATSSQQGEDYYYVWDETNNSAITLVDAGRLKDLPRFGSPGGPCDSVRLAGRRCQFDTRDYFYDPTTHHLIESVHAQGQFWNFDMDAYFNYAGGRDWAPAYGNNGSWLSDIPRYNQPGRPCYQKPYQQCIMNARLFQYNLGADMLWELEGFGENTIGGLGGQVVQVYDPSDWKTGETIKPGTLRWALELGGNSGNPDTPLIVAFAPGLGNVINLQRPICVASNKTLDGRGSAMTITGWGLRIVKKSNVVLNNVTIQDITRVDNQFACANENKLAFKDQDEYQNAPAGDDAIRLVEATNVWLHHLTLKHSIDGLIDIGSNGDDDTATSRNITISWSRFENHRKTALIGTSRGHPADRFITATLHHNYYTRTVERHPRVRYAKVDIYNNYVDGWGTDGSFGVDPTRGENRTDANGIVTTCAGQVLVEENIFERKWYSREPALEYSASDDPPGSCKRGSTTYSNLGAGRSINNWPRDGGGGLPSANSFQESLVFGRPYTAYSIQHNVQGNEAFRTQLMSLPGSK